MKSWAVLMAAAGLVLATGCSARPAAPATSPPAAAPGSTAPAVPAAPAAPAARGALNSDDEELAGVTVGGPVLTVVSSLGEPARQRPAGTLQYWDFSNGITVYVNPKELLVLGVHVGQTWTGATPRGLKLGDNEKRVLSLYGEPNYLGKNLMIAGKHTYVDEQTGLALSIDLNDDKVTGMQLLLLTPEAVGGAPKPT